MGSEDKKPRIDGWGLKRCDGSFAIILCDSKDDAYYFLGPGEEVVPVRLVEVKEAKP